MTYEEAIKLHCGVNTVSRRLGMKDYQDWEETDNAQT